MTTLQSINISVEELLDAIKREYSNVAGWIAGGLPEVDLLKSVQQSGFENVEIRHRHNIFEGVPNPSSALDYGTIGISLSAQKSKNWGNYSLMYQPWQPNVPWLIG
jgi:hypothetical protein